MDARAKSVGKMASQDGWCRAGAAPATPGQVQPRRRSGIPSGGPPKAVAFPPSPIRRATSAPKGRPGGAPPSPRASRPREAGRSGGLRKRAASASRVPLARSASSSSSASADHALRSAALAAAGGEVRRSHVQVAVRCRPLTESEEAEGDAAVFVHAGRVSVLADGPSELGGGAASRQHDFRFDHVFGPDADQLVLFSTCGAPLVDQLFDGFNVAIFAYGQTGSGKTYTMMGDAEQPGLTPRICWFLFDRIRAIRAAEEGGSGRRFRVSVSYVQIYHETLYDMLPPADSPPDHAEQLRIRCCPEVRTYPSAPARAPRAHAAPAPRTGGLRPTPAARRAARRLRRRAGRARR